MCVRGPKFDAAKGVVAAAFMGGMVISLQPRSPPCVGR